VISVPNLAQQYVAQRVVQWTDHVSTVPIPTFKLLPAPPVSVVTGALLATSSAIKMANPTASLSLVPKTMANAMVVATQATSAIDATKHATKDVRTTGAVSPMAPAPAKLVTTVPSVLLNVQMDASTPYVELETVKKSVIKVAYKLFGVMIVDRNVAMAVLTKTA
jgi:hypothetical protein